ncbi:hypothetical protein ACP3UN_23345, partial [Klebsiella pneumoniae]
YRPTVAQEMGGDHSINKACTNCKGSGKVKVPNIREMSFGEKREFVERRHEQRELDELSQMEKLERMMGC